jgi:dephospho-CoA kinase
MEKYNEDGTINKEYLDAAIKQEKENLRKLEAAINEVKTERASHN